MLVVFIVGRYTSFILKSFVKKLVFIFMLIRVIYGGSSSMVEYKTVDLVKRVRFSPTALLHIH